MTEIYCGRGFEADRHYWGLLWFSTWGPLTIPLTFFDSYSGLDSAILTVFVIGPYTSATTSL